MAAEYNTITWDTVTHFQDSNEVTLCSITPPDGVEVHMGEHPFVSCRVCQMKADGAFLDDLGKATLHGSLPIRTQDRLFNVACNFRRAFEQSVENSHWSIWAKRVLANMNSKGVGYKSDEDALRSIIKTGVEPYYTLKIFANKHGLD